MKQTMKKFFWMFVLLAVPFAMQAQTKYHDVEFNDATGPVKCIKTSVMGMDQTINFTQDGKMQSDILSDVVYDADGYVQSLAQEMRGQKMNLRFKWENGKVVSQFMNMMGQDVEVKRTYNSDGTPAAEIMDMGGQKMEIPYSDYKLDARGNWVSRKTSMMGNEMVQTRTIEYYE